MKYLGLIYFVFAYSLSANEQVDAPANEVTSTRVFSCSVHFPLDSVQFEESSIQHCFEGVDTTRISYIHVIATASTDGSNRHNLYLSTRRAGAIEGYLKNRFKDIEVHAFGGGANPKFGKMARIFIVESPLVPDTATEQSQATDTTPAPQIQIEYRERSKTAYSIHLGYGLARFQSDQANYTLRSVGLTTGLKHHLNQEWLKAIDLGLRYGHASSDTRLDLQLLGITIGSSVDLMKVMSYRTVVLGHLGAGIVHSSRDTKADASLGAVLGLKSRDIFAGIEFGYGHHLSWVGLYASYDL
jgi:hypothetical protein